MRGLESGWGRSGKVYSEGREKRVGVEVAFAVECVPSRSHANGVVEMKMRRR
jgi:hypothetical protein